MIRGILLAVTGARKRRRDGLTMSNMAPPANGIIIRTISRTAKLSRQTHHNLHTLLGDLTDLWNSALSMRKQYYEHHGGWLAAVSWQDQFKVLTAATPRRTRYEAMARNGTA